MVHFRNVYIPALIFWETTLAYLRNGTLLSYPMFGERVNVRF
jgi:hypothetical protein